jgi:phosphoribosylaminoimidazole-succinocarboxamide synthase
MAVDPAEQRTISSAVDVITAPEQLNLPLPVSSTGKVRFMFDCDEKTLRSLNCDASLLETLKREGISECMLIVTTDRWSAFDYKMPQGIPFKGRVLNSMSNLTFTLTKDIIPNHIITTDMSLVFGGQFLSQLNGRSVLVKKAETIPFECVVRGYLYGSALEEYAKNSGIVNGMQLPPGLVKASKLKEPVFTPSTKSKTGHDENVTFEFVEKQLGQERADELRRKSIEVYQRIAGYFLERGLILADTKFEFGLINGKLTLIDEAVTPDSSRIWNIADYKEGADQAGSIDKQFLRDWLTNEGGWTKEKQAAGIEPPKLPPEILCAAAEKYLKAYSVFTGHPPAVVSILMGSKSDEKVANGAAAALESHGVWFGTHVISAHRNPAKLRSYIKETDSDPYVKLHIAIAGLSAALPGAIASETVKPVLGVPASGELSLQGGLDAVMSMVQMPPGVPVGVTGPVNSGKNAGIFAAQLLAMYNQELAAKLRSRIAPQ